MPAISTAASTAPARLVRLPYVLLHTALSKSALHVRIAKGEFPRPVSLGARAVAWRLDEVEAWIATRAVAATPLPAAAIEARRANVARRRSEQAAA